MVETLEERYAADPRLLRLYRLRLLRPGWPGKRDVVEKEYIRRVKARRAAQPRQETRQRGVTMGSTEKVALHP